MKHHRIVQDSLESLSVELDNALRGNPLSKRLHGLVWPEEFTPDISAAGHFRVSEIRASRLIVNLSVRTGQRSWEVDADLSQSDPKFVLKRTMQHMRLISKGLEWEAWWPTYELEKAP